VQQQLHHQLGIMLREGLTIDIEYLTTQQALRLEVHLVHLELAERTVVMNEPAPKSEGLLLADGRARQIEISQPAPLRTQLLGEHVQAARLVHAIPVLGAPAKRHVH